MTTSPSNDVQPIADKPALVVLISGSGTNLQALIDAIDQGRLNARIAAVISNKPNAFGLERAAQHDIATTVLDHTQYADRHAFDQALRQAIGQFDPALVILAGFMRILTEEFVHHFAGKLMNIHPSLLPKYKGLNTHARAIEAGDAEHGCSVHFVTPELDGGPIIGQRRVTIDINETPDTLALKIQKEEHLLYPQCAELFVQNRLQLSEHGLVLDGQPLPPQGIDLTGRDTL